MNSGILAIIDDEDTQDEVVQRIDQPLEVQMDTDSGLEFLKCEYNRDGDSWRSPYTKAYFPPIPEGEDQDVFYPEGDLKTLEEAANKVLKEYTNLYFGDAISNAYFFETTDTGFGAVFLIKNQIEGTKGV